MSDARDVADFASQLRFTTAAAYDAAVAGGRSAFFPAAPMMTPSTAMLQLMSPLARRACLARARAAPLAAASASDAAAKGCQRLKPTVEIVIKESGHSYEEKDELVLKCSHGGISFEVPLNVDTVSCGIQRAAAVLSRFDTAPLPSLTCLPCRLTATRRT
jgi:hypothetical protein